MRFAPFLPLMLLLAATSEPQVRSPNGRMVVFVNERGTEPGLWIRDVVSGRARRVVAPRADDDPARNLTELKHPVFSLDGGYVYFEASAWAASSAVHQVELSTGRIRFVTDGWLYGVLRNGPWRGYLLVGQHRYHGPPHYGSFNPVAVIRPDGKKMLQVPGSERDDGAESVEAWMRRKGWTL